MLTIDEMNLIETEVERGTPRSESRVKPSPEERKYRASMERHLAEWRKTNPNAGFRTTYPL